LAFFFNDIMPESGGTQICVDSVGAVARFLAQQPEGIHPGSVSDYILPHMKSECSEFTELTGEGEWNDKRASIALLRAEHGWIVCLMA
jgi:hypothetical protein